MEVVVKNTVFDRCIRVDWVVVCKNIYPADFVQFKGLSLYTVFRSNAFIFNDHICCRSVFFIDSVYVKSDIILLESISAIVSKIFGNALFFFNKIIGFVALTGFN